MQPAAEQHKTERKKAKKSPLVSGKATFVVTRDRSTCMLEKSLQIQKH